MQLSAFVKSSDSCLLKCCYLLGVLHLSVKSFLFLGALLLSASPAIADDFLYMVCKIKGNNTSTHLTSGDVLNKDVEDYLMFKVNLSKSLFRNNRDPEWDRISVIGNTIVQDKKINREGFSAHIRGVLPLNPPGPFSIDNWFKNTTEYQVIKGKGDCRKIDSSKWQKFAVN